jgi:hypothetical protein
MADLFGIAGRRLLAGLDIPEPWRGHVDASLELIDELELRIGRIEGELRRERGTMIVGPGNRRLRRLIGTICGPVDVLLAGIYAKRTKAGAGSVIGTRRLRCSPTAPLAALLTSVALAVLALTAAPPALGAVRDCSGNRPLGQTGAWYGDMSVRNLSCHRAQRALRGA